MTKLLRTKRFFTAGAALVRQFSQTYPLVTHSPLKIRGARGVMNNVMDAGQSRATGC
jgi:hypothetical protein